MNAKTNPPAFCSNEGMILLYISYLKEWRTGFYDWDEGGWYTNGIPLDENAVTYWARLPILP